MIFALLPYIFQLLLIIHIIKTGRPFAWLWLIVFLPYIGGIAYLILELIPDLMHSQTLHKAGNSINLAISPNRKIEELEHLVKKQETVANKVSLAEAYASNEQYQKAIELFKSCLKGPYEHDAVIEFKIVECYFHEGKLEEAKAALEEFKEHNKITDEKQSLIELLINQDFEKLKDIFFNTSNFEIGYYYAKHCAETNNIEEVQHILDEMNENRKDYPSMKKGLNAEWYRKTKHLLF